MAGPGQPKRAPKNPELCAVSQIRDDDDVFNVNGGKSATCALTGGIVAALKSMELRDGFPLTIRNVS